MSHLWLSHLLYCSIKHWRVPPVKMISKADFNHLYLWHSVLFKISLLSNFCFWYPWLCQFLWIKQVPPQVTSSILRDYPVFGTVCLFLTKRFLRRQQYLLSKITFGLISLNITTLLIHALFTYHVHVLTVSLLSLTVPIFRLSHCWGSPSVTLFLFITYYCVYCKARNNNNNLSHNCQDMATLEELAVHLSHNCRDMATVEELAVNLSYNCRDMATVEELAVDNSHNFQDKLPGRARR